MRNLSKRTALLLSAALLLSPFQNGLSGVRQTKSAEPTISNPRVTGDATTWDCVYFGNYWQNDTNKDGKADQKDKKEPIKWRVLFVEGDDAFLMADQNLDCQPYHTENVDVTWETCSLRKWLNEDFFNAAFSVKEQVAIPTTRIINNTEHDSQNSTEDKVYLLSWSEAVNTAYGFSAKDDIDNTRRVTHTTYAKDCGASKNKEEYEGNGGWWLRTSQLPGISTSGCVDLDGYIYPAGGHVTGYAPFEGFTHVNDTAVRPVLHLDLSQKGLYTYAGEVSSSDAASKPSVSPSASAEATSSTAPSTAPSGLPSIAPSGSPSGTPSGTPGITPTGLPSSIPSGLPSVSPSTSPDVLPSPSAVPDDDADDPDSDADDDSDDEPDDEPTAKPTPTKAAKVSKFSDKKSNAEYKVLTRTKSGGTVTLKRPLKDSKKAVIPATVTYSKKKYKVTNISSKAFYGRKKLKEVTIGKNVTTIGSKAFYQCTALREITLPAKVKKIGSFAFYNCRKMNEVSIETKKLTSKNVGSDAFYRIGNINYKKLVTDVPMSKLSAYTKLLKKRGISPKSVIMPAGGNIEAYRPQPDPVELSKDYLSLTVKKSNSGTKYGTATVKLKQAKGVQIKTVTCNVKNQGIATATIKGNTNLSVKVKAKKKGDTKITLSLRYQKGRKTKTKKLTLDVEVTLKDTRKKTTKKPGTTAPKTPAPSATAKPSPAPVKPTPTPVQKNENDISALYKIIGEQREIAASKGIRLDNIDNLNSDCYTWDESGNLVGINWNKYELSGQISFSELKHLKEINCGAGTISSIDVTGNASLTKLACGSNQLAALDISRNTLLEYLDCHSNQLTTLNVSQNILLKYLDCHDNKFAILNLNNNSQLEYLNCDRKVTVFGYAKATQVPGTATSSPTVATSAPTISPSPSQATDTGDITTAVASTNEEIDAALAMQSLRRLEITSNEKVNLIVPAGTYSNVDLVVNLPNGELENYGAFKSVTIQQIAQNTYIEKAIGNIIDVICKKAHIIVGEDASASIILSKENMDIAIENNGIIKKLDVKTQGKVEITGLSKEKISVDISAEVEISSTIKLDINATSRFDITIRPGAESTEVTVDIEAHVPKILGLGIITVKIKGTGTIQNVVGENTGKEELAKTVKMTGTVRDVEGNPIEGAEIYIVRYSGNDYNVADIWTDTEALRVTTDAAGEYSTDDSIKAGNYYLAARKDGYMDLTRQIVVITSAYGDTYTNEEITMVPTEWAGKTGNVTGKILDSAQKDLALPDISVRLRKGKGSMDSGITVEQETRTDAEGVYRFDDLEAGYYTIELADDKTQAAGGEAYLTTWINVLIRPGETVTEGAIMSKTLLENQFRFVLSWGSKDSGAVADLDAHLTGPAGSWWNSNERFHTYFDNKSYDNRNSENRSKADLDVDDMDWEGPETTTIYEKIPGVYSYCVHDYTNRLSNDSAQLSESSVKVEVYNGNVKQNTYYIPQKKGTVWHVFDYDSSTNTFQTFNTMYYESYPYDVGQTVEQYKTDISSDLNFLKNYHASLEGGTGDDILQKVTVYQERMDALTKKQDDKAIELLREVEQYRDSLEYECFPSCGFKINSYYRDAAKGEMTLRISNADYVPVADDLEAETGCTMTEVTPAKENAWKAFRVVAANGHARTIHVYLEYYTNTVSLSVQSVKAGNTSLSYVHGNSIQNYSCLYIYSSQAENFQLEDIEITFRGNPTSVTHNSKKVEGEYTVTAQTDKENKTYIVRKMPVPEISDTENTIHKTKISGNDLTVYADSKTLSEACAFTVNGKQYALERKKSDPEYNYYTAYDTEHGFSWYIKCYAQDSTAGQ